MAEITETLETVDAPVADAPVGDAPEAFVTLDSSGLALSSGLITVYNYDSETGAFTGATQEYVPEGVGIPAYACCDAPPVVEAGEVALFVAGAWQVRPDYRGQTVYSTETRKATMITKEGPLPEGITLLPPSSEFDEWDGGQWVKNESAEKAYYAGKASQQKTDLIQQATLRIQTLQDAVDLEMATDEETALLVSWKKYRVLLSRVDTGTAPDITWPPVPE